MTTLLEVVLPLGVVATDASWQLVGTAFIVGIPEPKSALLLTAAHNVERIRALEVGRDRSHLTTLPEFRPSTDYFEITKTAPFVHLVQAGRRGILVEVHEAWELGTLDVALLLASIRPEVDVVFEKALSLDTRPIDPDVGIWTAGYSSLKAQFNTPPDYEAQVFAVRYEFQLQTLWGQVVQVYPQGSGIHRGPGFLVNCPFHSGMSGGPVITFAGRIPTARGIITGDLSESADAPDVGSGARAFAAMLWPAMAMRTNVVLHGADDRVLQPRRSRLMDFVRHGVVNDLGRAHKHVRSAPNSAALLWEEPYIDRLRRVWHALRRRL